MFLCKIKKNKEATVTSNLKVMYKKLSFFLVIATIPITSLAQPSNKHFEIVGKLAGFADSTLIYLEDLTTSSPVSLDSTFVINNQFCFTGTMKEDITRVIIRSNDYSNYKYFWLENSNITFTATKNKFSDAIIIGSKTQDEQTLLDAAIKSTGNEKEQSILFIQNNPNSIISASILCLNAATWGKDTTLMLYQSLTEPIRNTSYGKNVFEFTTLNKYLKVGDRYVNFAQTDIEGKAVSLSEFEGKVVLLEFWASWCVVCRQNNSELVKIYNDFKNKGFNILGVAAEYEKIKWIEAVRKDGLSWSNVSDLNGDRNKAVLMYGVSDFPTNFLIDRNGIIVAKNLKNDDLRNKLNELLR